jgi:hypothetical protein
LPAGLFFERSDGRESARFLFSSQLATAMAERPDMPDNDADASWDGDADAELGGLPGQIGAESAARSVWGGKGPARWAGFFERARLAAMGRKADAKQSGARTYIDLAHETLATARACPPGPLAMDPPAGLDDLQGAYGAMLAAQGLFLEPGANDADLDLAWRLAIWARERVNAFAASDRDARPAFAGLPQAYARSQPEPEEKNFVVLGDPKLWPSLFGPERLGADSRWRRAMLGSEEPFCAPSTAVSAAAALPGSTLVAALDGPDTLLSRVVHAARAFFFGLRARRSVHVHRAGWRQLTPHVANTGQWVWLIGVCAPLLQLGGRPAAHPKSQRESAWRQWAFDLLAESHGAAQGQGAESLARWSLAFGALVFNVRWPGRDLDLGFVASDAMASLGQAFFANAALDDIVPERPSPFSVAENARREHRAIVESIADLGRLARELRVDPRPFFAHAESSGVASLYPFCERWLAEHEALGLAREVGARAPGDADGGREDSEGSGAKTPSAQGSDVARSAPGSPPQGRKARRL